jgi:hypothetical protein
LGLGVGQILGLVAGELELVEFVGEFDELVQGEEEFDTAVGDGELESVEVVGLLGEEVLLVTVEGQFHFVEDFATQLWQISFNHLYSLLLALERVHCLYTQLQVLVQLPE